MRRKVFTHYGTKCACPPCGETNELFLQIDHIDNDGASHRRAIFGEKHRTSAGKKFYRWLITNNFPSGFQTLCANCNTGKARNGGVCPHMFGFSSEEIAGHARVSSLKQLPKELQAKFAAEIVALLIKRIKSGNPPAWLVEAFQRGNQSE